MQTHLLNPDTTLLVGDTVHDAEVAEALGIACILYAGGHNSLDSAFRKGCSRYTTKRSAFIHLIGNSPAYNSPAYVRSVLFLYME